MKIHPDSFYPSKSKGKNVHFHELTNEDLKHLVETKYWDGVEVQPEVLEDGAKEVMRDPKAKYTYFRLDFEDSPEDFDYTICETLKDVHRYIQMCETNLDDPDLNCKVIITGVAMTPKQYSEWVKENEP